MKKSASATSLSRAPALSADHFILQTQIGTGSFGTVFKAVHRPTGRACAVKRIDLENSEDEIEEIRREISILAECHDPHITRYFGSFIHEFELWIVMEFLGGGSCLDLLKDLRPSALPEAAIAEVVAEVASGLAYLHQSGKIHRDIKAANILISEDGGIKIADFGVAAQLSNNLSRRNTFVGTPFWMAPEVIDQRDYSFSADVWSLGITAIELAQGKPPLAHLHPMKALFTIPRSDPPKLDQRFSAEFQDFVARCLQRGPRDRATVAQLQKHPFLSRRNRHELLYLMRQRMPPPLATSDLSGASSPPGTLTAAPSAGRTGSADSQATLLSGDASTLAGETLTAANGGSGSSGASTSSAFSGAPTRTSQSTAAPASASVSSSPVRGSVTEDEDDWDFGTVHPQPSLEQLLRHPPPTSVPAAIPAPLPRKQHSGYATVDSVRDTVNGSRAGGQSLARSFAHASRKFREPVLGEIAELLRGDPLTVDVETYLVRRIGRLAYNNFDLKPREKKPGLDAVEQILLDKWVSEVSSLHARSAAR